MRLRDLKLGKKQALIFGVILAMMVGSNIYTMTRLNRLTREVARIGGEWIPTAVEISAIGRETAQLRIAQLGYFFARDDSTRALLTTRMVDRIGAIEMSQDALEPFIDTAKESALYATYDERWEQYLDLGYRFLSLSQEGSRAEASQVLNVEGQDVFENLIGALTSFVLTVQTESIESARGAEETFNKTRHVVRTLFLATIGISVLLIVLLVRWITTPVWQLASAAESVASGDLNVHVERESKDEIGQLARAFNKMTSSLRDARERIHAQQRELRATNDELAGKNRDLERAMKQLQEAQQQLVMSEKMASLGNLVAGVAHEINNPVGAVSSAADTSARSIALLNRQLDAAATLDGLREDKRFRTALDILCSNNEVIVTASARIATIVKSLKNFARLDESDFQETDIHEGLDSTLTLLNHQIKNHVDVITDYGQLQRIQCYPNRLNQVFMNLLSNAGHAITDSGTITIRTRDKGDHVVIEISDTGSGIPADKLDKIFDPGFTTKGVGVGTGLGLSISYNIIQNHRGRIEVESEVGKGTTMRITLPARQDDAFLSADNRDS